jgi:CheY-like chemotaxis protein
VPNALRNRILIVDDESSICTTVGLLLSNEGYEIASAQNGFDALLHMRITVPDLVISDLNMPQMSGFEFLSVLRRRFPRILVIAMSGAYAAGDEVPGGVIADAFYAKGSSHPATLVKLVADLLRTSASRAIEHSADSAPVWVPRNGKDSRGVPYIVLTCTQCLRSFPLNVSSEVTGTVMETPCIFCLNEVRYIIDFSLSVASPKKKMGVASIVGSAA